MAATPTATWERNFYERPALLMAIAAGIAAAFFVRFFGFFLPALPGVSDRQPGLLATIALPVATWVVWRGQRRRRIVCNPAGFAVLTEHWPAGVQRSTHSWADVTTTRYYQVHTRHRNADDAWTRVRHYFAVHTAAGPAFVVERDLMGREAFVDLIGLFGERTPHVPYEWLPLSEWRLGPLAFPVEPGDDFARVERGRPHEAADAPLGPLPTAHGPAQDAPGQDRRLTLRPEAGGDAWPYAHDWYEFRRRDGLLLPCAGGLWLGATGLLVFGGTLLGIVLLAAGVLLPLALWHSHRPLTVVCKPREFVVAVPGQLTAPRETLQEALDRLGIGIDVEAALPDYDRTVYRWAAVTAVRYGRPAGLLAAWRSPRLTVNAGARVAFSAAPREIARFDDLLEICNQMTPQLPYVWAPVANPARQSHGGDYRQVERRPVASPVSLAGTSTLPRES